MSKNTYTTRYPQGTIVYIFDENHSNRAPYLIVSCDDTDYAMPFIAMRITSKNNDELNQYVKVPVCIDCHTSFIQVSKTYSLTWQDLNNSRCSDDFVMRELVELCLHMFMSRLGLYRRLDAIQEFEAYKEYYMTLDIPLYDETQKMYNPRDLKTMYINKQDAKENSISYENKTSKPQKIIVLSSTTDSTPEKPNKSKPKRRIKSITVPKFVKKWSTPELIQWTNDKANFTIEEMKRKYKIKSSQSVYQRNISVMKELEKRGILESMSSDSQELFEN